MLTEVKKTPEPKTSEAKVSAAPPVVAQSAPIAAAISSTTATTVKAPVLPAPAPERARPPVAEELRDLPSMKPMAGKIEAFDSAMAALDDAARELRAFLPPSGAEWQKAVASGDIKKAAAALYRASTKYSAWAIAARSANETAVAAVDTALVGLQKSAAAEVARRLAALERCLAAVPAKYNDTPATAIARAGTQLEADQLRKDFWSAWTVARWLHLPEELVSESAIPAGGQPSAATPEGWPLGDLSESARAGLRRLFDVSWTLLPEDAVTLRR